MQRSYKSGASKRKIKQALEIENKKVRGSILKYTVLQNDDEKSSSTETVDIISPATTSENLNDFSNTFDKIQRSDSVGDTQISSSSEKSEVSSVKEQFFNSDPATWESINELMIEHFISNPPPQNLDILPETTKVIAGCKRALSANNFYRLKNDKKLLREWLILSKSSKSLFCWICKLFNTSSFKHNSSLSTSGFSDWKHVSVRLEEHENSYSHRECILKFSSRLKFSQRIDSSIVLQCESEVKYWRSVLERVVATVKFLAIRGLAFFGENETIGSPQNGNFLGCMELMAQFDPFLAGHLEKFANAGSGHTNYLSSTSINEFIDLMGKRVLNKINEEVKEAKYFSIIVDSTPDISHLDQLCFILRYINSEREVVERFVQFIPIHGHGSEYLVNTVLDTIGTMGLDIKNITGQSYDNASNMAGKYSGLQARIKNINPLAEFVPCSAHSLNLVGVNAAESNIQVINFFGVVQELYNFFSASTHRWQLLQTNCSESKISLKK